MKKTIFSIFLIFTVLFACVTAVSAEDVPVSDVSSENAPTAEVSAENVLTSDSFTLYVDVIQPEGELVPSTLRFNLFSENGEWLGNRYAEIGGTGRLTFTFHVPVYEIGAKFKLVATTGISYLNYCDTDYALNQEFIVETYAYRDENGQLVISDEAYIAACPLFSIDSWAKSAEDVVNGNRIWSDTDYLVWVSKSNFTVSVFLRDNGAWRCIKYFPCSIGAPNTPTVTGQFRYYQYQTRWQYSGYYVGPIMRFYGGYAIHSTLLNNNGTDRDGRTGKMISHGCVRVRPENMNWLTYYVPLGTKIYVTNQ